MWSPIPRPQGNKSRMNQAPEQPLSWTILYVMSHPIPNTWHHHIRQGGDKRPNQPSPKEFSLSWRYKNWLQAHKSVGSPLSQPTVLKASPTLVNSILSFCLMSRNSFPAHARAATTLYRLLTLHFHHSHYCLPCFLFWTHSLPLHSRHLSSSFRPFYFFGDFFLSPHLSVSHSPSWMPV